MFQVGFMTLLYFQLLSSLLAGAFVSVIRTVFVELYFYLRLHQDALMRQAKNLVFY